MNVKITQFSTGVKRKFLEPLTIFSHNAADPGEWLSFPYNSSHCSKYLCLNMEGSYLTVTDPDEICYPKGKLVFGD